MFINGGLNKFFNYIPQPEDMPAATMEMFEGLMKVVWLMPLLGIAEIVGGILFIIYLWVIYENLEKYMPLIK